MIPDDDSLVLNYPTVPSARGGSRGYWLPPIPLNQSDIGLIKSYLDYHGNRPKTRLPRYEMDHSQGKLQSTRSLKY